MREENNYIATTRNSGPREFGTLPEENTVQKRFFDFLLFFVVFWAARKRRIAVCFSDNILINYVIFYKNDADDCSS